MNSVGWTWNNCCNWILWCLKTLIIKTDSCRAAHEAGAATAIVNVGVTRADDFVPLKINARIGEV